MRRIRAFGWAVVTCCAVSACGGGDSGERATAAATTATPARPSIRVSVPPAPAQTGTKQVRFDPCVEIGDEVVGRLGFDPGTRERDSGEMATDLLTSIGCDFNRVAVVDGEKIITGSVALISSNDTLAEIRSDKARNFLGDEPIRGRPALVYSTPQLPGICTASMSAPDGVFEVNLIVFPGPVPVPPPCDEIRSLAEGFAAALDGK
ncbi:DUF3558 domain-containing protein [Nocardia sp. NPDC004068]|uniref:DUF3558 domain-containing protein n=1 Tax=Nocardia sp. NPDC004068 TaxID=3364303 RepID=UPI0036A6BA9E